MKPCGQFCDLFFYIFFLHMTRYSSWCIWRFLDALSEIDPVAILVLSAKQIAYAASMDEIMWYVKWLCLVTVFDLCVSSFACEDSFTKVKCYTDILRGTKKLILMEASQSLMSDSVWMLKYLQMSFAHGADLPWAVFKPSGLLLNVIVRHRNCTQMIRSEGHRMPLFMCSWIQEVSEKVY